MKKFLVCIFFFGLFSISAQSKGKELLGEWFFSGNEDITSISCFFNENGTCVIRRSIYTSVSFNYEIKDNILFINEQGYYYNFYNQKNNVLVLIPAFGEATQIIQMIKL